jgi:hypothetical protein
MPRTKGRISDVNDPVNRVAGALALDVDTVRARVEAVLSEPLYWFPVRHHSPAVARHLETVILQRRPRVLFIEGPAEANDLIPHIVDAKTKPPVAIYSSYRDDDNVLGLAGIASAAEDVPARFAAWYPLLAYSPEYVAMLAAKKVGAEVVFMDLPHYALIKPHEKVGVASRAAPEPEGPARLAGPTVEVEEDRLIVESGFYQRLAAVAGFRSWNEAWDTLFEGRITDDDPELLRRELATFCAAARATSSSERVEADGTLPRERFMLHTIRDTLRARKLKPEQALVICGGFHLFLDRDDPQPPLEPPAGTVYTTVVPYSFFRVSELSGYAAGNRAPQFYQTFWELARAGQTGDLLARHVTAVLAQARKEGEPLSSADAIAACQHAEMLARLRGRPAPVLDDIHHALVTCCCKGAPDSEGVHLLKAIDHADIGNKIGRVTDALGRLPIVNDFYAQLDELDLGDLLGKEKRLALLLDKRQRLDERRSVFLHRLRFLAIEIGGMTDAPSGDLTAGTIFREKWALRWGPQVEPALIEQNLYGDTVEAAVLEKLREELAKEGLHAGRTCARLVQAIDLDLPDLVRQVEDACGRAIDADSRFVSLSQALGRLCVLERYAVYRNLRRDLLGDLIVRCFDRACFSILDVIATPEEEQPEVVTALLALAEVVLQGERKGLERPLFAEHVRKAAGETKVPFLRGVFLGMLAELRELGPEQLAAEVSALARASADRMVTAGDFLDGIMAVSRTSILLGADALIGAVDELLRAAEWEAFLTMLPRMRAAFERLHERQRDALAERVAHRYGLTEKEALTELRTSVGAAALIARIDRQVDEIMKAWDF